MAWKDVLQIGRFPGPVMHGRIRGDTLEAQGKGLDILLILMEGAERPLDENRHPVCMSAIGSSSL